MAYQLEAEQAERVINWIKDRADRQGTAVIVYQDGVVREGDWLHVPVSVLQGDDAYDRAMLLQAIEDEWDPNAFGGIQLLLVPAKANASSNVEFYNHLSQLLKRQHALVDQMQKEGPDGQNAERLASIRTEWEETLREMERIYPGINADVP